VNYYRFHRSADQGNAHAQNNLGICYEEGLAVPRDYSKAKEYYKKASDANHPSATNNLGFIYLLERNYGEALKTFHIAAALGRYYLFANCYSISLIIIRHKAPMPCTILEPCLNQEFIIHKTILISFWRLSIFRNLPRSIMQKLSLN
jgi:tetratricopeptide (TPR) repeat protein